MDKSLFILATDVKQLCIINFPIFKDQLGHHLVEEATWEIEGEIQTQYPYQFEALETS